MVKTFILYLCDVTDLKPTEVLEAIIQAVVFFTIIAVSFKPFIWLMLEVGKVLFRTC